MSETEMASRTLRVVRDSLLKETDLWGLSDYPATQAQLDYRQALRDLPSQAGFPDSVTWPTKPTE